jgi:hypothetical protein
VTGVFSCHGFPNLCERLQAEARPVLRARSYPCAHYPKSGPRK